MGMGRREWGINKLSHRVLIIKKKGESEVGREKWGWVRQVVYSITNKEEGEEK